MARRFIFLLILVILALAAGAIYWFGTPRLVDFSPEDTQLDISPDRILQIRFSRPMRTDEVISRLQISPAVPGSYRWEGNRLEFVPAGRWPAGATIRVRLASGARAAGWLSLPVTQPAEWVFTIRRPRLLYLYPSNQASNLYLYNPREEKAQPITSLLGGILEYDATRDGSAVYYSTENSQGGSDIYRLALDSLEANLVLACQQDKCRAPRASPSEQFLAYERTAPVGGAEPDYPQVWWVPLVRSETPASAQVSANPSAARRAGDPLHQTLQPDWSSQNVLSFYDTNQQAFILLAPLSGQSTSLPNQTGEPGGWTPDGLAYLAPEIFFNTGGSPETVPELRPVASSHLLRFSLEDGSITDLTKVESLEDTAPLYSPDGEWIAFARKYLDINRWTPGRQLWLMRQDGSDARQLTNQPDFNHYGFSWDPDGKLLAFVRFDQTAPANLPAVWVYDLDLEFESELAVGGYAPRWIP